MITCHAEDIDFLLTHETEVRTWIADVVSKHDQEIDSITYIFCSDDYLLEINREHLDHDYFTDIITFPLHEPGEALFSDIFISIDRVKENAQELGHLFEDELHRVMIHGVLHLLGLSDATPDEKDAMRSAENAALSLRSFL